MVIKRIIDGKEVVIIHSKEEIQEAQEERENTLFAEEMNAFFEGCQNEVLMYCCSKYVEYKHHGEAWIKHYFQHLHKLDDNLKDFEDSDEDDFEEGDCIGCPFDEGYGCCSCPDDCDDCDKIDGCDDCEQDAKEEMDAFLDHLSLIGEPMEKMISLVNVLLKDGKSFTEACDIAFPEAFKDALPQLIALAEAIGE